MRSILRSKIEVCNDGGETIRKSCNNIWADSATTNGIVNFVAWDGTVQSYTFTEWCEREAQETGYAAQGDPSLTTDRCAQGFL